MSHAPITPEVVANTVYSWKHVSDCVSKVKKIMLKLGDKLNIIKIAPNLATEDNVEMSTITGIKNNQSQGY